jgi:endonuclease YncB( thermonuclease family)
MRISLCKQLLKWAVYTYLSLATAPLLAYEISSSARVNEDGSLRIKGKTIQLYGIHIPQTNYTCTSHRRPPVCSSRAALALDFKINGFVRCNIVGETDDGHLIGQCRVGSSRFDEGEDLSAYLLEKGWAVALPDAAFEYQTLEKIAQSRNLGIWGIPVDNIKRR